MLWPVPGTCTVPEPVPVWTVLLPLPTIDTESPVPLPTVTVSLPLPMIDTLSLLPLPTLTCRCRCR